MTFAVRRPPPLRYLWVALFEPVPFALTAIAVAWTAWARGRRGLAIAGLAGCFGAVVSAELVLKPLIDRGRRRFDGVNHRSVHFGSGMFPSAHVTGAAAVAMFAWLILDRRSRLAPLFVLLPLLVGYSVVSRQMHFPSDVLGGLLLGPTFVFCTLATARAWARGSHDATSKGEAAASSPAIKHPRDAYPASQRESA